MSCIKDGNGTSVGDNVGIGAGRGIAMLFIISALFLWISNVYAFANPGIRNLESELPDAIPDEPEGIGGVQESEEVEPVMQTSGG